MMGIILMEFVVRFLARGNKHVAKFIGFFYVLVFLLELLVMYSRVFLGMHALNQVLFGLVIGIYSFIPYYLYVEKWIIWGCLELVKTKRFLTELFIIFALMVVCIVA